MKPLIVSFMMTAGVMLTPTAILAQDNVVPDQPTTDQDDGTVTTRSTDWLWLIPVIGIPLLLYALAQSQRSDDRQMSGRDLAGSKGGEATRRKNRDDSMMEE